MEPGIDPRREGGCGCRFWAKRVPEDLQGLGRSGEGTGKGVLASVGNMRPGISARLDPRGGVLPALPSGP